MKDDIFSRGESASGSFCFNNDVASVFDDMANRSIPYYKEVIQLCGQTAATFVPNGGLVYDLGCSTGNTLLYLAKTLHDRQVRLVGCDPATAMLEKARQKADGFTYSHNITFIQSGCEEISLEQADMIILNYTLQFIDKSERSSLLKKIYQSLKPGGLLLLSEKLRQENTRVESFNTDTYEKFKAGNGYSFLEIANKRQALENILVPESLNQNIDRLKNAGFQEVETIFKWLNFASFAAFKEL